MFTDNSKLNKVEESTMNFNTLAKEDAHNVHMTGEVIDKIYKNGVLVETIEGHNLVVNSFLKLVMLLLKNQNGHKGATYWAIGSGADSWDTTSVTPSLNETRLTNEIGRVAIPASEIVFLDNNYEETTTPTNIIQITHTFGTADCNGKWREFGIFGGNATTDANSGLMINKRHHGVITKTEEMTVERTMRFTLNFS